MPYLLEDSYGNREAVEVSRFLSRPGAVALGAGLGLAISLLAVDHGVPGLTVAGLGLCGWIYGLLLLAWLDVPGDGDPVSLVRAAGRRQWAFFVAWIELFGLVSVAALLAQGAADRLAQISHWWLGMELSAVDYLPLILGLVAINELIGTRPHSRSKTWGVAVALAALWIVLLRAEWRQPSLPEVIDADHGGLPIALWAAALWGPHLLLSRRSLLSRRRGGALGPMIALWLLQLAVAMVALWTRSWGRGAVLGRDDLDWAAYQLLIFGLCALGLSQALAGGLRAWVTMTGEGLLPAALTRSRSERGVPWVPLAVLAIAAGWAAVAVSGLDLVAAAAGSMLLLTAFFLWPHIRARRDAPAALRLPAHPTIPVLVAAGGLFLTLLLPRPILGAIVVWLAVGFLWFWFYGRSALSQRDGKRQVVGDLPSREMKARRVLVAVGPGPGLQTLVQVAACTAASREADLLVLQVAPLIEQMPLSEARFQARGRLKELRRRLETLRLPDDLVYRPLVRLAPSVAEGILDALVETSAELLVLGRSRTDRMEESSQGEGEAIAEQVFRSSSRAMVVVHGELPSKPARLLVATAGGPHAAVALEVAEALATEPTAALRDGRLTCQTGASEAALIHVITPKPDAGQGEDAIRQTLKRRREAEETEEKSPPTEVEVAPAEPAESVGSPESRAEDEVVGATATPPRKVREGMGAEADSAEDEATEETVKEIGQIVVRAGNVASGLRREVTRQDILLLGASVDRLLGQTRIEGLAGDIAMEHRGLTLLVKRAEDTSRYLGRRLWEAVANPLPRLTDTERAQVQLAMRSAARAGIDFYILISLSAAIATLGLMQSSAAVVIGAMLVAPLMSPILGLGHAMVRGYLRQMRRAATSTLNGIGIAIGVGAVFPLLFPGTPPTAEMLARGAPSLLDLGVALVSGAAAAYAVSRPSVAAALPGVAIAAALVPPLCVVGFGLGASETALAGGALLLFTTNLCAIVLSSAAVFLMMGFRPAKDHAGRTVWRFLSLGAWALFLISIPLALQSRRTMEAAQWQQEVRQRVAAVRSESFEVVSVELKTKESGLTVKLRVESLVDDLPMEAFQSLSRELTESLGRPVTLDLRVVEVTRRSLSGDSRPVEGGGAASELGAVP